MGEQHKINILDGYGHDGNIIFKAGTTCYKSEDKTKKTSDDFIKMFKKAKHLSMLEFMWVTVVVRDFNHIIEDKVFSREKFLIANRLIDHNTVISGNARAWLDFVNRFKMYFEDLNDKKREKNLYWIAYNTIGELLNAANPTMFDSNFEKLKKPLEASLVLSIDENDIALYEKHHWVAIKFERVSRALIDEFIRHRQMSYAVSSTRYIDNSNFKYILPDVEEDTFKILDDTFELIKDKYKVLLEKGVKKDIARQLLPLGISQEIVVAGTIENWNKIFEVRCQPNAHQEIRDLLSSVRELEVFKCVSSQE
jgi:thymidylate synthase ThyX